MKNTVDLLTICFKNEILASEIPLFRGAVIHAIQDKADVLFHNHVGQSFRYAYPLIQYKRIRKKAAIVCLKQGTEVVGQFLSEKISSLCLADRQIDLEMEGIYPQRCLVQLWTSMFLYRIYQWLPLNSKNYGEWLTLESMSDKVLFLENILRANLLSFAKGVNVHLDAEVICKIVTINRSFLVVNKGVKLMAFDLEFKTNLSLPNHIGIGKNVSIGYGFIIHI